MRSKVDAKDYRYFPEPDLVPVVIDDAWIHRIKARQPEFQDEKILRYREEFGLPEYDAQIITSSRRMAELFEKAAYLCGKPKKVSNWLMVETLRLLKEHGMEPEEIRFSPENLAKLVNLYVGALDELLHELTGEGSIGQVLLVEGPKQLVKAPVGG